MSKGLFDIFIVRSLDIRGLVKMIRANGVIEAVFMTEQEAVDWCKEQIWEEKDGKRRAKSHRFLSREEMEDHVIWEIDLADANYWVEKHSVQAIGSTLKELTFIAVCARSEKQSTKRDERVLGPVTVVKMNPYIVDRDISYPVMVWTLDRKWIALATYPTEVERAHPLIQLAAEAE